MSQFEEGAPVWANRELSESLSSLCARGEGQHLEFKVQLPNQGHDIGKSLAAFASSGGGQLLYGVTDQGEIIGLEAAHFASARDEIERRIQGAAREVKPPVSAKVLWAHQDGRAVCVVQIWSGAEALYYSNHRPMIRAGSMSRPAEPTEVERLYRTHLGGGSVVAMPAATLQISARMRKVLELMNHNDHEPVTVADLARAMELQSPLDLDRVIEGTSPPTFAFIDEFCSRFAVSTEWLSTGRGQPFDTRISYCPDPLQYYDAIEQFKPKAVYLVRSNSPVGEASIFVYENRFKVHRVPAVWHVSNHVGGGGTSDLIALYHLFKKWSEAVKSYMVLGRSVEPKLAKALFDGLVHPGIVEHMHLSHWWDDLTDLEGRWTSSQGCAKEYGKTFVAAKEIIRRNLG